MRKILLALVVGITVVSLAACGDDSDDSASTTTEATTSTTAAATSTTAAAGKAIIETFDIASDVTCTEGENVEVKADWTTRDVASVELEVDGTVEQRDLDASGSASVAVACDGNSHQVGLIGIADGKQAASVVHQVKTEPGTPEGLPVIDGFSAGDVTCSGTEGIASATWQTTDATTVSFSVDGQPLSADAGQPTSTDDGSIGQIPCDGGHHSITLTAGNDRGATHKSVTVTSPAEGGGSASSTTSSTTAGS
jgi:hypothetical protein